MWSGSSSFFANTSGATTKLFLTHWCGRSVRSSAHTRLLVLRFLVVVVGAQVRIDPVTRLLLDALVVARLGRLDLAARDADEQLAAAFLLVVLEPGRGAIGRLHHQRRAGLRDRLAVVVDRGLAVLVDRDAVGVHHRDLVDQDGLALGDHVVGDRVVGAARVAGVIALARADLGEHDLALVALDLVQLVALVEPADDLLAIGPGDRRAVGSDVRDLL